MAQKEELIEFEFKVFGLGGDNYQGLFYHDGKNYLPLKFHRTHRSVKTYEYRGPAEFSVYVKNPNFLISNPSSPRYLKVATIPITTDTNRFLIVFSALPRDRTVQATKRRFNLFALNDDRDYFPANTIVMLNTTGAELFGRVAETAIHLPTGPSEPIPYKTEGSGKSETKIALALETEEGSRLVMSNDVRLSSNRRVLLILEPPRRPNSYRIEVRKLSESIFPEQDGDEN